MTLQTHYSFCKAIFLFLSFCYALNVTKTLHLHEHIIRYEGDLIKGSDILWSKENLKCNCYEWLIFILFKLSGFITCVFLIKLCYESIIISKIC